MERLGILGGTFDPVHVGHVAAATEARAACRLDRVLLVPAGDPWQKAGAVVASPTDRMAMVEAAAAAVDGLEPSRLELDRTGATVTAETLEALRAPDRRLFLVLGSDAVANMATWRRLDETKHLATVVVVDRLGERVDPPGEGWTVEHVAIPRIDMSSTELRERLMTGRPVDGWIPPAVVRVIRERGIYTSS